MSKYQRAYQCDKCKTVYSRNKFEWINDLYFYCICPKCGNEGRISKVVAKPKMFGLLGWKVKENN